jgi:hypothetical protein
MQRTLDEFVERLKVAAAGNLRSVILYGSATTGEHQEEHSDLNALVLLRSVGAGEIESLAPAVQWWMGKGYPAPHVFTAEELAASADIFAIELMDIQASHRVLFGEDPLAAMHVPTTLHRFQVERELRINAQRLRQAILTGKQSDSARLQLMKDSVSTFLTLFRHALIAIGEHAPVGKSVDRAAIVDRIAKLAAADPAAFHHILNLRSGHTASHSLEPARDLSGYMKFVESVATEVDRRLAAAAFPDRRPATAD